MKHLLNLAILLVLGVVCGACASGGLDSTRFVNPDFDFGYLQKVAVLPMENLSTDQQAGVRATRLLITELLATGALDVVEPGEVRVAYESIADRQRAPTTQQIVDLGKRLGVEAVLFGTVAQSETLRSGTVGIPVVTLDVHMVETETGVAVWAATHSEKGGGMSAKWLGTGAEPISETTRRCVRRVVASLFQ